MSDENQYQELRDRIMQIEFRQENFETVQAKHMEKEDQRWEKIESHMAMVRKGVYIGLGVLIAFAAKDLLSALGLFSRFVG